MDDCDRERIEWHEAGACLGSDRLTGYRLPLFRDPLLELEFNGDKKYRILYSEIQDIVDEMESEMLSLRKECKKWWEIWK
jgi:hypothetical protein